MNKRYAYDEEDEDEQESAQRVIFTRPEPKANHTVSSVWPPNDSIRFIGGLYRRFSKGSFRSFGSYISALQNKESVEDFFTESYIDREAILSAPSTIDCCSLHTI